MYPFALPSSAKNNFWLIVILAFIAGNIVSFSFLHIKSRKEKDYSCRSNYHVYRTTGFNNIQPLLFVKRNRESRRYAGLKGELGTLVAQLRDKGVLKEASVYLEEFDQGRWISVNGDRKYHPASIMKVAVMLYYLRKAETTPGFLAQKWLFRKPDSADINPQYFNSLTIESGKEYSIHELLFSMLAHSDNNATWMLLNNLEANEVNKLFNELNLPEPDLDGLKLTMSPEDISVFFKTIFNVAYLGPEYSEYAAELLSHSTFDGGFARGFPEGTKMWRKFGEWNTPGADHELHEAGVVFIAGVPYLLTVMTKGDDVKKLAEGIATICHKVYEGIVAIDKIPVNQSPPSSKK